MQQEIAVCVTFCCRTDSTIRFDLWLPGSLRCLLPTGTNVSLPGVPDTHLQEIVGVVYGCNTSYLSNGFALEMLLRVELQQLSFDDEALLLGVGYLKNKKERLVE